MQVIPYPYRQSADFLYLTGVTQPYALAAIDSSQRYALFVPDRDSWREQWDGARLGVEAAEAVFGADEALPLSQVQPPPCWVLLHCWLSHLRCGCRRGS